MDGSRVPLALAALVAFGVAALVAFLPAPAAATQRPPSPARVATTPLTPQAAAQRAIDAITSGTDAQPLAAIPADFDKVMGYRPTLGRLADGEILAINPNGGCSVIGGGRPFDLSTVCKAHDLGYDLLRYAHQRGEPLATQARIQVDTAFAADLDAQCASRYTGGETTGCDAVAETFKAAVDFNSWRQGYGPPVQTAGMVRTAGVFGFGLLLLYFGVRALGLRLADALKRRRSARSGTLAMATGL